MSSWPAPNPSARSTTFVQKPNFGYAPWMTVGDLTLFLSRFPANMPVLLPDEQASWWSTIGHVDGPGHAPDGWDPEPTGHQYPTLYRGDAYDCRYH